MNNNTLMFAPMSVRLAAQGVRDRRERAEKLEAERIEREAAQAREKSREQLDAEFAQNMLATSAEAVAKQQAIERANFDAVERQKQEEEAKVILQGQASGQVIVEQIKPTLDALMAVANTQVALMTEIRALVAQLKDGQHTEKET